MISFRVGNRLVVIQSATYIVPFYQVSEAGGFESKDATDSNSTVSSNVSTTTHRLLIPTFKVSIVKSEPEFSVAQFEEKAHE